MDLVIEEVEREDRAGDTTAMGSQLSQLIAEQTAKGDVKSGTSQSQSTSPRSRHEISIVKVKASKDKEVLSAVEELAKHLPQLYSLSAKECKIQKIPQEAVLAMAAHLVVLNLEHNKLTALPSFSRLEDLRELHLPQNKFVTFPSTLNEMAHLEVLDLSSNAIPEIQAKDMEGMRSLLSINLSKNLLTAFPAVLCALPSLTSMDLGENRISSLPKQVNCSHHIHLRQVVKGGCHLISWLDVQCCPLF